MQTKLDRFGRVVLPKAVRDDLGLEPGTTLTVQGEGSRIVLEPHRDADASLLVRDGVHVWTGPATGDVEGTTRALRGSRLARLAGL